MNSEKQSTNLQMTLREVNRVGEVKKNIPKLRFKGYEDAWEQRKAKRLFVSWVDKGYPDLPVLSATQDKGMVRRDENGINIHYDEKNKSGYKRVMPGQFVIHLRSFQGGFAYSEVEGITSPAYTVFDFKEFDKHIPEFWKYVFSSKDFIRRLEKVTYGIRDGRSIGFEDFLTLKFNVPEKREQKVIAEILAGVNNLITLHQRKYDALKSMKKTLLSKIFPKNGEDVPEIRFKGYTDAWEQRKLGEIVLSEIKGSAKAEMIGGDTPYLETNYLNGGECLFVDSENNVDTDDVIVLWDGSQAGTVYHGFSGALGSTFKAYKTKCLGLFIFQQLKKNQQTIYDKYRTPNIPHVIKTFKDEYDVMLTSEEEQNEIGRYFQQIDHLITLHQRKLEELKKMKKTLLQQMFV